MNRSRYIVYLTMFFFSVTWGQDCVEGVEVELWGECYNIEETTILDPYWSSTSGQVIPPEIGQLTNLTGLHLIDNELTGEIPSEICNQGDSSPYLNNNQLCPPYPDCGEGLITSEGDQDTSNCP